MHKSLQEIREKVWYFYIFKCNFFKKLLTFDNKSKPRELAVAKVIKVLTKILFSYSDKIQLFKLK